MRISDWSSDVCSSELPAYLPFGAAPVGPAEDLAPETDREGIGLHPAPAADDIMAIFVHEDERAKNGEESDEIEPDGHVRHVRAGPQNAARSEEHTSELQSLMRISYAVFCLKKKKKKTYQSETIQSRQSKRQTQITANNNPKINRLLNIARTNRKLQQI